MAARTKRITFGKAGMHMHIKVPSNWPRISQRAPRSKKHGSLRYMAEIRGKRLGAALKKRAVTVLARALRKAPGAPEKSASQLSCLLLKLETWRFVFSRLNCFA